ncbi:hypothetical protein KP509_33G043600 [Ceratopteris richardii]|uniref:Uncharacterized protein n=1 Tax=Ceratopteris richardii TaxID=49495 RepID=A0A8T2QNH3_CERRI|nr:hypothetical protein KP509_33G043600 [Ceratopteris richardii]
MHLYVCTVCFVFISIKRGIRANRSAFVSLASSSSPSSVLSEPINQRLFSHSFSLIYLEDVTFSRMANIYTTNHYFRRFLAGSQRVSTTEVRFLSSNICLLLHRKIIIRVVIKHICARLILDVMSP